MIRDLTRLFRLRLSLMNGIAALAGCLLSPLPPGIPVMAIAAAGVTLLAMGGSALNQLLERDLDLLMNRTMNRPLPRRSMSLLTVTLLGTAAISSGCLLLLAGGSARAALLGLAALAWYLAVYTPLKRRTAFALLLGALSGALPPVIGWALAGGSLTDFRIVLLAGLFYLWQVPHFWLFQQRHADDYRRAGIPLFRFRSSVVMTWIAALAAAALLLPAFGLAGRQTAIVYILFPLPLLVLVLYRLERPLFSYLNIFPLLVTLSLMIRS